MLSSLEKSGPELGFGIVMLIWAQAAAEIGLVSALLKPEPNSFNVSTPTDNFHFLFNYSFGSKFLNHPAVDIL